MTIDHRLETRQAFWETPRNLIIAAGALSAIVAAIAGAVGYRAGQQQSLPAVFPPGTVITIPPAAVR